MPYAHQGEVKYAWQQQGDIVTSQAAAVQNTWYTFLATQDDCRLMFAVVDISVANETLEVEILIDGQTCTGTVAAVFGTQYFTHLYEASMVANALTLNVTPQTLYDSFIFEGHSVRVRARKTTNGGAGTLRMKVGYSLLLPT